MRGEWQKITLVNAPSASARAGQLLPVAHGCLQHRPDVSPRYAPLTSHRPTAARDSGVLPLVPRRLGRDESEERARPIRASPDRQLPTVQSPHEPSAASPSCARTLQATRKGSKVVWLLIRVVDGLNPPLPGGGGGTAAKRPLSTLLSPPSLQALRPVDPSRPSSSPTAS